MISRVIDRVDRLFGFTGPHRDFLKRRLPAGVGYWHCFGGMTFTLFLLLLVSGLFLSVHYVPSEDAAYTSVRLINEEVWGGRVLRSVHKWSANLIVITLLIHMTRVFVMKAYRHPRELNWVVGTGLLLLVLTFGFTGYLLPWNQKAYWATVVGTAMPGTVPLAGGMLVRLFRGSEDVTGATLLRFYSLHTHWLPLVSLVLLWAHFHMVKRRGIAGGL